MPTSTFAISSDANDGWGRRVSTTGWGDIQTGTYSDDPDTSVLALSKIFAGGTTYSVSVTQLRFDMDSPLSGSVIPLTATIVSGNLLIYCLDKSFGGDAEYAADFYDFAGSPSTSADWVNPSPGDAIATITRAAFTIGAVATFALTGLSGIVKTGFTGIRLAAKTATAPTLDDWIDLAPFTAAEQEARLEVTYTEAAATIPIRSQFLDYDYSR